MTQCHNCHPEFELMDHVVCFVSAVEKAQYRLELLGVCARFPGLGSAHQHLTSAVSDTSKQWTGGPRYFVLGTHCEESTLRT